MSTIKFNATHKTAPYYLWYGRRVNFADYIAPAKRLRAAKELARELAALGFNVKIRNRKHEVVGDYRATA